MEFRLVYEGSLPAASQSNNRAKDKHLIRKALHPQLRELWRVNPTLVNIAQETMNVEGKPTTALAFLSSQWDRMGYKFVPLIGPFFDLHCALDILFLRRQNPGELVRRGGDLDNRIKVLFDALRMPQRLEELGGFATPGADEDPFYCLLQDDSLISDLRISTDRLLKPVAPGGYESDVMLIINVKTISVKSEVEGVFL